MDRSQAYKLLEKAGYTWREYYSMIKCVEDDRRWPVSRKKANRLNRVRRLLEEVGINPDEIVFEFEVNRMNQWEYEWEDTDSTITEDT
jgi:hypothetical protein